jgi:hypothetical protein
MFRYIFLALAGLTALAAAPSSAPAAEATLHLRGSDLIVTGTVISFDGYTYRLETERFGKVNIDLRRYECVSGVCLATTVNSAATAAARSKEIVSIPPLTTNNQISVLAEKQNTQLFQEFLKWQNKQTTQLFQEFLEWQNKPAQKKPVRRKPARIKAMQVIPVRTNVVQNKPVRTNFVEKKDKQKKALGRITRSETWWFQGYFR